jgi:DNA-binding GntR family transcriptional regulator
MQNEGKSLNLLVRKRLIEAMLRHEIVPGQRLIFIDLATQFAISRTPINNALSILAQEGFVDFVPNQGYSVHRFTRHEVADLLDIREGLELGFMQKALDNLKPTAYRKMEKYRHTYKETASTALDRRLFLLELEFFCAIIDLADNKSLSTYYRSINQKIYMSFRTEVLQEKRIQQSLELHDQLFSAIEKKDRNGASKAIMLLKTTQLTDFTKYDRGDRILKPQTFNKSQLHFTSGNMNQHIP